MTRRDFLAATAAFPALTTITTAANAKPKLRKAVKFSMVNPKGATTLDKFELVKKLGFEGVEIDSPSGVNKLAAKRAAEKTGIVIHGVIDNLHWNFPLSSPDANVRAEGLAALEGALEDAHYYGAENVLLVPGVARNGVSFEQCNERSQAEVRKVLPLAEKLKIKIAIEVVWNDFITKPEQLVKYVDDFKSPWVGAYFDCSNMVKYGVSSGDWIRALDKRMVKFDFKGYKKGAEKPWVEIGEGDENWPDVLKALDEIGYSGWATAEVGGGGEKELKLVFDQMTKVLEQ